MKKKLAGPLVVAIFVLAGQACGQRVTDGLVALWDFDLGSGTVVHDVSGVGEPVDVNIVRGHLGDQLRWTPGGLLVEAPTLVSSLPAGAAKVYDMLTETSDVTIEAWLRPATENAKVGDANGRILTMGVGTSEGIRLHQSTAYGADAYDGGFNDLYGGQANPEAAHQHVVFTFTNDINNRTMYLDGEQQSDDAEQGQEQGCGFGDNVSVGHLGK
jgi:hypothetical protein